MSIAKRESTIVKGTIYEMMIISCSQDIGSCSRFSVQARVNISRGCRRGRVEPLDFISTSHTTTSLHHHVSFNNLTRIRFRTVQPVCNQIKAHLILSKIKTKKMVGLLANRAQFGLILPSTNTSVEAEFNRMLVPGTSPTSSHPQFSNHKTRSIMALRPNLRPQP